MKTEKNRTIASRADRGASSEGAALIICLGLLSVMTLLSVAFAISMRIERMAARNFADTIRAKQLIHVALVRAFEDIDNTMSDSRSLAEQQEGGPPVPVVYPVWTSLVERGTLLIEKGIVGGDVMWSYHPDGEEANIREGEALSFIPGGSGDPMDLVDPMDLLTQSEFADTRWITNNIHRGRVSYIVINNSGLLDANSVAGTNRTYSSHVSEIDVSDTPEFVGTIDSFVNDRHRDFRYETPGELAQMNDSIRAGEPVSSFSVYSHDIARDKIFLKKRIDQMSDTEKREWWKLIDLGRPATNLGHRVAQFHLHDKFNLNSITNFDGYYKPGDLNGYTSDSGPDGFMQNYFYPLVGILEMAGFLRANDIAWNIVNYLDPDRIPQGEDSRPWTHTEGGEAIPMINEIVLEEEPVFGNRMYCLGAFGGQGQWIDGAHGSAYRLSVELWYPYAPVTVDPDDNFSFQLGIFRSRETILPPERVMTSTNLVSQLSKLNEPITNMVFGTDDEFVVFDQLIGFHTNGSATLARISVDNHFYFLGRVVKDEGIFSDVPVDEAMGYESNPGLNINRKMYDFTAPIVFQVNDPRSNGQQKYWRIIDRFNNGLSWHPSEGGHSLDEMNITPHRSIRNRQNQPVCDPWSFRGHGLPIYAQNGPMRNIAELGHIFRSNLDDEEGPDKPWMWYWRNIDLMHRKEGAQLLDLLTVRAATNEPTAGLFSMNSRQFEPSRAIFHNLEIGLTGVVDTVSASIPDQKIRSLIDELTRNEFTSFTDMFTAEDDDEGGGGPLAEAFRQCAPDVPVEARRHANHRSANDIYKEDVFRHICELITFRQNLFTIILGAQALSPRGNFVVAEKRAVANVYRDAYTGRHFVRSFKWLDD